MPKAAVMLEDGVAVEIYEAYGEREQPVLIGIIAGMRVEHDRVILNVASMGKFKVTEHPMPQIERLQDYQPRRGNE